MFRIAWKNAWYNKFHSVLSLLLFALGVGLISFLLQVQHRLQQNFEKNLDKIRSLNFDDKFIRIWRFYLSASIASFTSNRTSVIQAEIKHE